VGERARVRAAGARRDTQNSRHIRSCPLHAALAPPRDHARTRAHTHGAGVCQAAMGAGHAARQSGARAGRVPWRAAGRAGARRCVGPGRRPDHRCARECVCVWGGGACCVWCVCGVCVVCVWCVCGVCVVCVCVVCAGVSGRL
jgi:hypothetical protein